MTRKFRTQLRLEWLEDRTTPTPVLTYATYMPTMIYAEAVDAAGNAYLAGGDNSAGLVAKLNSAGTGLSYSTSLGRQVNGIAIDGAGDAYVTGTGAVTPTANAYSQTPSDAFFAKLDLAGNVVYCTYIPGALPGHGNGIDWGVQSAIAVDSAGNAYITGRAAAGLPTTAGAFQSTAAGSRANAYLAEFNPNLSGAASLVYATFLGGSGGPTSLMNGDGCDVGTGVAVDGAGKVYLTGFTASTDFPTTAGAFRRTYGGDGNDVFIAKFDPALSGAASLVYSTYLGGTGSDGDLVTVLTHTNGPGTLFGTNGPGIAVDASGNAYVTGYTNSKNFPVTAGAYQTSNTQGYGLAFVTKLNAAGSGLAYSTYLCTKPANATYGPHETTGTRIIVDAAGNAYVAGLTSSSTFPTVNPIQKGYGGLGDVFVSTLNAAGSKLLFSTYLGGTGSDIGMAIGLDAHNNTYVVGVTGSSNFPVTPGAYQTSGTSWTGFAAMIDPPVEPGPVSHANALAADYVIWLTPGPAVWSLRDGPDSDAADRAPHVGLEIEAVLPEQTFAGNRIA